MEILPRFDSPALSDDQIGDRGRDEDGGKSEVRSEHKLTHVLQKERVM